MIIKSKGVHSSSLSGDDYKNLLNEKQISHGLKISSKKDYVKGYVKLETKRNIRLNPMSYRKRIKIYDYLTKK